ncbi:tyrosine-protein phosphatase non-receptor type 14-like [Dreissena polymorpha]|uniref:tyrosine-protein phosphatase non-receptor type 14-like n=1 Tax=Dreissena polymorpha TaxID=45954 RepID=UPI0022648CD8|nr:tyrosine-protein phosphatase non-receptor type 14-like [Dreissena polymorpha]
MNVVRRGITEIYLEWVPGFNGGLQHTFIINYTDTHLEIWNAVRVPVDRTTHTLRGLKPDTTYKVKMRAENIVGNSTWTDYITISTLAEIEQKGSVSKAVGGTVGGLSVICIIVAVIIVWRRRKTGPLASTRADFWSMIWEQNVGVVAMVTNLVEESKRNCFQYWPISSENDCQYSDYTIRLLSEENYANFVVRTLHCTKSGSIKVLTVHHLHLTAWPDKDVPDTALSFMQFWRKVRNFEKTDGAPWIVHCSTFPNHTSLIEKKTFGEKDRLILTQSAIVSSAIDFVRLLHDHVIRTVVTFVDEYEGFEVRIIRFSKWSKTLDSCNIKDLMSLLISVQESACRRLVVLQCRDGYSQSGLFAVLWCLVERCQRDGEVAVAEIVKMIRRRRKQVITNELCIRDSSQEHWIRVDTAMMATTPNTPPTIPLIADVEE